ncbi:hypothetical protein SAMN05444397_10696 [Flavobacterium aquidurense]|uniref:DKNYY family protein n=1 Tax=Flavobacterium frigidimaris TaxID=262320 RepID=A0ABX4BSG8_FLAFR|nr:hypothetical protein [Flavobacterium frigidimaris]OXA79876.1 hypothetical protein B0A65_07970 [Flavobacterium frigidimaris]SDZ39522.1 hypothetical protein SAMN05444397_10696 [Flavobacterium aquidurense]
MKNHQKRSLFLIIFGLFLNIYTTHSQTSNNKTSINNWFDNTVGKENLPIYNGSRHVNYYRTLDNSHSYYVSGKFTTGSLRYEDQNYYNVELKYDVNNDVLVCKPVGAYDYMGINVIKEKTAGFSIYDKQFVNINYNNPSCPPDMNGYYQEIIFSKNNILYIKHHKSRKKVIDTKTISDGVNQNSTDEFKDKNEFILKYKEVYYRIISKSDVIKIFPEYKSKIKNYYNKNVQLEESDNTVFIENLIKEINTISNNVSN